MSNNSRHCAKGAKCKARIRQASKTMRVEGALQRSTCDVKSDDAFSWKNLSRGKSSGDKAQTLTQRAESKGVDERRTDVSGRDSR